MNRHILGLDLGVSSIGFAHIVECDDRNQSEIKQIGVRVNPLTTDEQTNFEKGKSISINADRTQKRGARKNLDRYQLRRKELIKILKDAKIIQNDTILAENGKNTTHSTWELRAKAVNERIEKEDFARILLAINKKRGYKSNRKTKNEDEGQLIDGMEIAKYMHQNNITVGQYIYQKLKEGKRQIPDFYRSDLQKEFDLVWNFQKSFYPEILTDDFYKNLQGKGQTATSQIFFAKYGFNTAQNPAKSREDKKLQAYLWRSEAVEKQLEKEVVAFVLAEINANINNSSGYLGAISDRSKELYFNNQTIGQYLYAQLKENSHTSLKNQVFYRQDYLDEFEKIWQKQAEFYPELTENLKKEIRDVVIFYQRKLKSQKGLISFCELESKEVEIGGKIKKIGARVAPKSSPLFQEFKIWQVLNNLTFRKKGLRKRITKNNQPTLFEEEKDIFSLDLEAKQILFDELNIKGNLKANEIIKTLGYNPADWEVNYTEIEGNRTNKALCDAYLKIADLEGNEIQKILGIKKAKDDYSIADAEISANEVKQNLRDIFSAMGIKASILDFDAELSDEEYINQDSYALWHLLYSYEGDDSNSGNETLYRILQEKYGFKREYAIILSNVQFSDDYGSLSTKAMRKIYPHIKENNYSDACVLAEYRHSKHSLTKEELESRVLENKLKLLPKNDLRQPVVEKILNQMINVVNALIEKNSEKDEQGNIIKYFHFDEIRIELARELKKSAKERAEMSVNINKANDEHKKIISVLQKEFGLKNPTQKDIIKYKLYKELESNGYKDLYSDTYISPDILFSKEIDIEHIIPKSRLFDDSFSNKTLAFRKTNLVEKGEKTAFDYMSNKGDKFEDFLSNIEKLYKNNKISKAKYQKLQKKATDIGDGFIERDLRETQYIAKKAKEILFKITKSVVSTSGGITDRLREDWGLVNIMKELNLPKYRALGLTEMEERKFGQKVEVIKDWTKRNDHRHHAMDALTVAFTKHSYIQYLNNLNARKDQNHKDYGSIMGIQNAETEKVKDKDGKEKRVFKEPMPHFRQVAKEHLENILISHKAKNKVVTKNKNKISGSDKIQETLTPRGQLHKETIYGKYHYYESKEITVNAKLTLDLAEKISNPKYKEAILKRLSENGNDPKKAFSGKNAINKVPIYLNNDKTEILPEKLKITWLEEDFSVRKDITPDNFKDEKTIDKILDEGIKRILKQRLKDFEGDYKKAFSDLDKNPIWLNKEKGISIKRVTISGVKNAEPLHYKKDHLGKEILDENGKPIPVDYISTGNNHHIAIYRDKDGNLQEKLVSFYEAVALANQNLPIIDKTYNQHLGWEFLFTMKQNEMFVFPSDDFNPNEIDLLDPKNKKKISPNLFRGQKFSFTGYKYVFRHHLETNVETKKELDNIAYKQFSNLEFAKNIVKVRINHLGDIVSIGEY